MTQTTQENTTKKTRTRKPRVKIQETNYVHESEQMPVPEDTAPTTIVVNNTAAVPDFSQEIRDIVTGTATTPSGNTPTYSKRDVGLERSKASSTTPAPNVEPTPANPVVTKGFVETMKNLCGLDMEVADNLLGDLLDTLILRSQAKTDSQKQRLTVVIMDQLKQDFAPLFVK